MIKITYYNKINYSLNKFYNSHYRTKMNIKQDILNNILIEGGNILDKYNVEVKVNNRLDIDNNIAIIKIIIDSLKGDKIKDDNTKYFKSLYITQDTSLLKNKMEIYIYDIK